MSKLKLHTATGGIYGKVSLPFSKSLSNRVLMIRALSGISFEIRNLSDSEDTEALKKLLLFDKNSLDVGHAGTAMRFLTAYLARTPGIWNLTGSDRMRERPIGVLVEALNSLGARIEYLGKIGFPPLRIQGKELHGGVLEIDASVSSQYISALLLIAPYMPAGLRLKLLGNQVSSAYVKMTVAVMEYFGIQVKTEADTLYVAPAPYTPRSFVVEPDWSAASYFYEMLAVAGEGELFLNGLKADSIQGDRTQVDLWEQLGVRTEFAPDGIVLKKVTKEGGHLTYNFVEMPDVVQAAVVACCLKGVTFDFSGLHTLRIKETDRIDALIRELKKLGYVLHAGGVGRLCWTGECCTPSGTVIDTYQDHRMAMAFAPVVLQTGSLEINDADVVKKSFPAYWYELEQLGISAAPVIGG